MKRLLLGVLSVLCLGLVGCEQQDSVELLPPKPVTLHVDAIGYYCRMSLSEHTGPQAQMFVAGADEPIWFSQVRDAVVYLRSPEELRKASAVYVSDMAVAESWDKPGVDNWINLQEAFLVIESSRKGGMGAPEVVPFGSLPTAQAFVEEFGGRISSIEDIPDSYVLSPMAM